MLRKIQIARYKSISILIITIILFILNQLIELIVTLVLNTSYLQACIWDCDPWYSSLVSAGYDSEPHIYHCNPWHSNLVKITCEAKSYAPKMKYAANWGFFPFFPLVARCLVHLTNIPVKTALILTSKAFLIASIYAFIKMAKEYSSDIEHIIAGAVVAFSPSAIYGNVGYTEPAFLFFSACFFYYIKKNKFVAASLFGAVLTSVRLVGIFSVFSYIVYVLTKYKKEALEIHLIFCLLLIPLGLALFMFYLYYLTGDALAFLHIQRVWTSQINPIKTIIQCLHSDLKTKCWLLLNITAMLIVAFLVYKKIYEFAIFSFFATVVPLSAGFVSPRYIFWQPQILFAISYLFSKNKAVCMFLLPMFAVGQVIMYIGWFAGKGWVT